MYEESGSWCGGVGAGKLAKISTEYLVDGSAVVGGACKKKGSGCVRRRWQGVMCYGMYRCVRREW